MARPLSQLYEIIAEIPAELAKKGEEAVIETVNEAGNDMYRSVNRIDTGFMKGSVGNGEFERSGSEFSGKFGWGVEGAETEDYFLYQEEGTTTISPMHALQGSFVRAREKFIERVDKMLETTL